MILHPKVINDIRNQKIVPQKEFVVVVVVVVVFVFGKRGGSG